MCVHFLSPIVLPKITLRERVWRRIARFVRGLVGNLRFLWPIILVYVVLLIALAANHFASRS